jgi:hypothetical protein
MGIEWVWMRARSETSRASLEGLIREQAAIYDRYHQLFADPLMPWWPEAEAAELSTELESIDERLWSAVDVVKEECFRVDPVMSCAILPIQWRREALRSFLREQLPATVSRISQWIAAVKRGDQRQDIEALFRYERARQAREFIAEGLDVAQPSNLPVLREPTLGNEPCEVDELATDDFLRLLTRKIHEHNKRHKRGRYRYPDSRLKTFENFAAAEASDSLAECLVKMERAHTNNCGLLLWG